VVGWQWKVGTGSSATTPTFSESFPAGTYNISLVVTDNRGALSTPGHRNDCCFASSSTDVSPSRILEQVGVQQAQASRLTDRGKLPATRFLQAIRPPSVSDGHGRAMQVLPNLGPIISNCVMLVPQGAGQAWELNSAGQVVGFSIITIQLHAAVWNGARIIDIAPDRGWEEPASRVHPSERLGGLIACKKRVSRQLARSVNPRSLRLLNPHLFQDP